MVPMKTRAQGAKKLVEGRGHAYDTEHAGHPPEPVGEREMTHSPQPGAKDDLSCRCCQALYGLTL
jgi:hypothetical protein